MEHGEDCDVDSCFPKKNWPDHSKTKRDKTVSVVRVKFEGAGNYHVYSRMLLGKFLFGEKKKEGEFWEDDEDMIYALKMKNLRAA